MVQISSVLIRETRVYPCPIPSSVWGEASLGSCYLLFFVVDKVHPFAGRVRGGVLQCITKPGGGQKFRVIV